MVMSSMEQVTHLDPLNTTTANVQSGHSPMPVRASPFGNFPCGLEVLQLYTSFCSGHQSQAAVCIHITQTMFSQDTASIYLGKALHAQPLDLDSKFFNIHLPTKAFLPVILPACLDSPQQHSRTECCRSSTFWQEAGR